MVVWWNRRYLSPHPITTFPPNRTSLPKLRRNRLLPKRPSLKLLHPTRPHPSYLCQSPLWKARRRTAVLPLTLPGLNPLLPMAPRRPIPLPPKLRRRMAAHPPIRATLKRLFPILPLLIHLMTTPHPKHTHLSLTLTMPQHRRHRPQSPMFPITGHLKHPTITGPRRLSILFPGGCVGVRRVDLFPKARQPLGGQETPADKQRKQHPGDRQPQKGMMIHQMQYGVDGAFGEGKGTLDRKVSFVRNL